ncbi:vitamin K-dependent protein C-like isoform X1 [Sphaerodactylus townsendi]|uniref:vitamin K-dependent protein C-like isoform X1 n=2 Tax=Sphaerodactylus townsendi TaxID=933632 RepID=UPI0020264336|nr:vitamin K-dependent protein C-like isoform X1 [Sphaerodactylus townsendi]
MVILLDLKCGAMRKNITLWLFAAAFLLPSGHEASVFYSDREANQVLKIQKRANSFLEELKGGFLERECYEEQCDFEEASEIFKTKEATLNFWTKYIDGDQCENVTCVNGTCVDSFERFSCVCNSGWEGHLCQHDNAFFHHFFYCSCYPVTNYTNCSIDNGGCDHFCHEDEVKDQRSCSCASGYQLKDDHTSCQTVVEFPCGRVVDPQSPISGLNIKLISGKPGKKGDSPWQVMLINGAGKFKCGGVLIHPTWVLTAAHCLEGEGVFKLKFGKYHRWRTDDGEQAIFTDKLVPHENYSRSTSDNDIALLHLAHPVFFNKYVLPICLPIKNLAEEQLMKEGTRMVVTGWGSQSGNSANNYTSVLNYIEIPVAPRNECVHAMHNSVSDNMLCAGIVGDQRDSCHGDSGGPMVTQFKNTWFLVGLVSWGEGCGKLDNFGIYTKVSSYLEWINQQIKAPLKPEKGK